MSKVDIKTLDSVTNNDTAATALINDNFKELQKAVENTLSRDGTTPNFMDTDLDMNSYRIINSADPVEDNDIVNLKYVNERIGGAAEAAASAKASASQAASSAQSALVSATNALNSANNAYTYAQEAKAASEDPNVIAVGTDLRKGDVSTIKITSESIDNVNVVGSNIASVNTTAEIKDSINTVAADKDNVDTVAGSIENVNKTGASINNVNKVAPHVDALETVAPDIMDVVTVAGIADKVSNVSDNMNHVVAVDQNKDNINKAVANEANITTAANNITNINTVAADITNIDQVVANKDNIDNVSANIPDVKNVSTNMQDVKDAVVSAGLAKSWAIDNIDNRPEGSSKYWAQQAQAAAQIGDATEEQKGWARLATANEAVAGTDDTTIMTPFKTALAVTDNVGRGIQLGFNGTLEGDTITFVPDQSAYTIKHGYDYEIDLLFAAVGSIPDTTKLVISNGEDTIQIVNVKHSDFNSPITYEDLKQVCRYDNEIGWRWIFNARFSVTDSGVKVFVMPSTVVSIPENVVTTDTAQNITAGKNFINDATATSPDAHTGMSISLQNSEAELGANTAGEDGSVDFKYQGIRMLDKNGEEISSIYSAPDGVGGSFTRLNASAKVDGQYVDGFVELEVDSNGKSHFYIPDVDDDSTVSGNQGATVEWVKANALPSQTGNAGKYLQTNGSKASWQQVSGTPVGTIIVWSTSTAPAGYLICDGSAVSRTTYAALFAVIGTTYGEGDGNSTFNLPNVVGKFLKGGTAGIINTESLPNITGKASGSREGRTVHTGVFIDSTFEEEQYSGHTSAAGYQITYDFNASNSSSVYKDGAKVQPDNVEVSYCVKY